MTAPVIGFVDAKTAGRLAQVPGLAVMPGRKVRAVVAHASAVDDKLAHHRAVVACARAGGVLPARYRQMSCADELQAFCDAFETALMARLDAGRDAIEIVLRARLAPGQQSEVGSYLRRKAATLRAAEDGPLSVAGLTAHLRAALPDAPVSIKSLGPDTPGLVATGSAMAHRAVLTDRQSGSAIAAALGRHLGEHCPGRDGFTLLGPLPPYSFLSVTVSDFGQEAAS